jgi:diguanylate cyclase (GGDEF)-like protein
VKGDGISRRVLLVALLPLLLVCTVGLLYAVAVGRASDSIAVFSVEAVLILACAVTAGFLIALIAGWRVVAGVKRSLVAIHATLEEIARGNYAARVRLKGGAPMAALAERVDNAASAIQQVDRALRERVEVAARQIGYQASHDGLTGLINRREFELRLEQALQSAREHDCEHALCFIDLDQFKVVNDTCGHVAGDQLLRQMAAHLRQKVREEDTLARIGGDEFTLLLENCSLDDAYHVATQLREAVQGFRFVWQDKPYTLGASIGVVLINRLSDSVATLLSQADAACYTAKDLGRNRVFIYQEDDEARQTRVSAMEWVTRIGRAFETDGFSLYCQRIVPLRAESVGDRYEILLRMKDPGARPISPMAFVPAAERYNLMVAVDRWVVSRSLSTLAKLRSFDDKGRRVVFSINLSGSSLCDEGFALFLREALDASGVAPRDVCFEVTETAAITHLVRAVRLMQELRELGCSFVLDDFGAGLSSFAYLRHLPIDGIKMDGAFVRGIASNSVDRSMVRAINEVGHSMGLTTTAEFVENAAIQARLVEIGVDYAQGSGIHEPVAIEECFAALLEPTSLVLPARLRTVGGRPARG